MSEKSAGRSSALVIRKHRIERAGVAIFGTRFQRSLSDALGVSDDAPSMKL